MKTFCFRVVTLLIAGCLLLGGCAPDNQEETHTTRSSTTTSASLSNDTTITTDTTSFTDTTASTEDPSSASSSTVTADSTTESTTATTKVPTASSESTTTATSVTSATASVKPTKTNVSTETTASTKRTFKVVTTTTTHVYTAAEKRDHIGFGYYRMTPEGMDIENKKGHLNIQSASMAPYCFEDHTLPYLRHTKELGQNQIAWLGVAETIFNFSKPVTQNVGWKDTLASMMKTIADEGLMDYVLGFYFDEPLLNGITKADFRDVTKYLRETYPDLRVFAVFAVNALDPTIWSVGNDQVLDYETAEFLTDAGYDTYLETSRYSSYVTLNKALVERIGREECRIWYVPGIMSGGGVGTEKQSLDHLEMMYRFLKAEKNPGGLWCYAYDISNGDGTLGNVGYNQKQGEWKDLEKRLLQIGKEIQRMNRDGETTF